MWDFKLLSATQTLEKTMAYMIYRLAMYLVLSFVLLFGVVAGTGSGLIMDSMVSSSEFYVRPGGIIGLALFSVILFLFRGSWFFSMRAPHLALLNEAMTDSVNRQGWAQVEYARGLIRQRFNNSTELSSLDMRVRGVLAHLFLTLNPIGQKLARIERNSLTSLLFKMLEGPVVWVHEIVIAECLKHPERSASSAAVLALNAYARNFNRLLSNAFALLALKYAMVLVIYFAMLSPVAWIDEFFPIAFGTWRYIFAALLTWPIKSALFDPIIVAAMIRVFRDLSQGQEADPKWKDQLNQDSPEFASLVRQSEFLENQAKSAPKPAGDEIADS